MNMMGTSGSKPTIHSGNSTPGRRRNGISLRRFPYPYRAAMAICSDIDGTRTTDEFLEIQRFLNTKGVTSMGEGIGLEIGNSFYFYDVAGQFSYFSRDERARAVIIDLIRAGFIDCLHSYGDAATSRDQVERAIDALTAEDCRLRVWTNHFNARSNIGRKFEHLFGSCEGDNPGGRIYHADLTLAYGIRYAWVGSHTRIVGQDSGDSYSWLATLWDPRYPASSFASTLKEARKIALGRAGSRRYAMHSSNQLMAPLGLADGQQLHEFKRYGNHPVSPGEGATSRGLAYVISERALRHLKARQGFMIVYSHLGKNSDSKEVIARESQAALRNLEREFREGQIYVTTTAKLLNYCAALRYLEWSHRQVEGRLEIHIHRMNDPVFGATVPQVDQLQGLTFCVPTSANVEVFVGGRRVEGIIGNPADSTGKNSITLPFTVLRYPY